MNGIPDLYNLSTHFEVALCMMYQHARLGDKAIWSKFSLGYESKMSYIRIHLL